MRHQKSMASKTNAAVNKPSERRPTRAIVWTKQPVRRRVERNTLESSAYRLPSEILSMIFKYTTEVAGGPVNDARHWQLNPGRLHGPGWFVLLWVCSKWRRVLIADASLWAACYSQYPKLQETFLARAGLVPLTYRHTAYEPRLSPYSAMFRDDDEQLAKFFFDTPFERCSEIYVSDGRGNDVTDYIFQLSALSIEHPLRQLRKLHLETWPWNWSGGIASMLCQGRDACTIIGEQLEDVYFENCWTIVSSPMLKRLASVFKTNQLTRPTIHVFYRAMKVMCGNTLTHLELTNPIGGSYRDDVRQYTADPIALPSLTHMSLLGYAPYIANILRIITWPTDSTKLKVKTIVGDGPQQSFLDEEDILSLCCSRS
ncbi:unnamed protein product [Peniophora sp. CBMAI 1063]|nr:unnamed protein product [Peniophora sp. CBMAI 1063]